MKSKFVVVDSYALLIHARFGADVVDAADEILVLARKLVRLEQQSEALASERAATLARYRKLIDQVRGANGAVPMPANGGASLRERVHMHLATSPGVPFSLDDIQNAVGAEVDRRKVIWTLANMKRDGIIKREGRGLWSYPQERPKEEDDPEF